MGLLGDLASGYRHSRNVGRRRCTGDLDLASDVSSRSAPARLWDRRCGHRSRATVVPASLCSRRLGPIPRTMRNDEFDGPSNDSYGQGMDRRSRPPHEGTSLRRGWPLRNYLASRHFLIAQNSIHSGTTAALDDVAMEASQGKNASCYDRRQRRSLELAEIPHRPAHPNRLHEITTRRYSIYHVRYELSRKSEVVGVWEEYRLGVRDPLSAYLPMFASCASGDMSLRDWVRASIQTGVDDGSHD